MASDVVKTAVAGFIKGAQVVIQEWNEKEETALVILKVGVTGPKSFAAVMYEKILTEPKIKQELEKPAFTPPAEAAAPAQSYDGLIIDATEYSFRPALINRIFNPKGEALYDPAKISQKVLVEQGCGEYTNSVDKARAALGRRGVKIRWSSRPPVRSARPTCRFRTALRYRSSPPTRPAVSWPMPGWRSC